MKSKKTVDELDKELQEVKAEIQRLRKGDVRVFKEWMDGQEIMNALHISHRTLQTLRYSGLLPYSRLHKKLYYKGSDVVALLDKNYSDHPFNPHSHD